MEKIQSIEIITNYGFKAERLKVDIQYLIDKIQEKDKENERLQEENERLRKNQKLTPEQRNHLHLELEEVLEIYKQRNKKAIEYIEKRKNLNWYADGVFVYELLNILQGEENEDN